ncbi:hypothetical protein V6N13_131053 [Hibiscus sabdariffa]|uniref:Uncharacterized protein n=1 Tax=Hibiscus sabdariffa TaxID=183260 RepID=A0ABR2D6Q9_9ROSI
MYQAELTPLRKSKKTTNTHHSSAVSKMSSDSNSFELQPPQLQMKQDDKFFSRLMSKEISKPNSSSRVYYAGASLAVPFTWESHPGTPKHPACDTTLPPLTPPPSYHSSSKSKSKQKKSSKSTLLSSIFPCLNYTSLSSWSSLHGPDSNPFANSSMNRKLMERRRSYFSYSRPPVHNCMDEDEEGDGLGFPTSTLCFGG